MLHTDLFYRSNEQFHVRYKENGERILEPYYLYYCFRPDGIWLCKTTDNPILKLEDFLASLNLNIVLANPDHDEPMDAKKELKYQSGFYELRNESVYLTWKHTQIKEESRNWYFRIRSADHLETDLEEIQLVPA